LLNLFWLMFLFSFNILPTSFSVLNEIMRLEIFKNLGITFFLQHIWRSSIFVCLSCLHYLFELFCLQLLYHIYYIIVSLLLCHFLSFSFIYRFCWYAVSEVFNGYQFVFWGGESFQIMMSVAVGLLYRNMINKSNC
jgi:hypothetical protein